MVISAVNSILSYFGVQLSSGIEDSSKPVSLQFLHQSSSTSDLSLLQHLEPGTEPFSPEQEFGQMSLTDYDSDEDADYDPQVLQLVCGLLGTLIKTSFEVEISEQCSVESEEVPKRKSGWANFGGLRGGGKWDKNVRHTCQCTNKIRGVL